MKNLTFCLIVFFWSTAIMAQNSPPVAVNDTLTIKPGRMITVPVIANDYDPDGDGFKVMVAPNAVSFTDSTITYNVPYTYQLEGKKYLSYYYVLIDDTYNTAPESQASVFIFIEDHFYDYLDVNNINARINSFGNHFFNPHDNDDSIRYEFPRGSGLNSIWSSSVWLGGIHNNDTLIAAEIYRFFGSDFWSGPLSVKDSVYIDEATVEDYRKVWKVSREEVLYHANHWNDPDYEMPASIATWPAHGDTSIYQSFYLAPFFDVDDDGLYHPELGDFPLAKGDQCIFFVYNDQKNNKNSGSAPIGLEIHGLAWAFSDNGRAGDHEALSNTIFLNCQVFNRSFKTLEDTYLGILADLDIGYSFDDFVGCNVEKGFFYAYNGDDYDESEPGNPGYGDIIPAQAVVILKGPLMDADGTDNSTGNCDAGINGSGFGDGIADNERFGMNHFAYFNNAALPFGDPLYYDEYYNYMNSIWEDGSPMEYGGTGHVDFGAYGPTCRFMFPALTDPCNWGTDGVEPFGPKNWTEVLADNEPGDRRGLTAMGPFTFHPGEVQEIEIAYVTAIDGTEAPLELLTQYVDTVKSLYYEDPDHFGYEWLDIPEAPEKQARLKIYPNPAKEEIYITLNGSSKNETEYHIYDLLGKEVMQGKLPSTRQARINISRLEMGFYLLGIRAKDFQLSGRFIRK